MASSGAAEPSGQVWAPEQGDVSEPRESAGAELALVENAVEQFGVAWMEVEVWMVGLMVVALLALRT